MNDSRWLVGIAYQLVAFNDFALDATCAVTNKEHAATGIVINTYKAYPVDLSLFSKVDSGGWVVLETLEKPTLKEYEVIYSYGALCFNKTFAVKDIAELFKCIQEHTELTLDGNLNIQFLGLKA